jgi:hypothetical protein
LAFRSISLRLAHPTTATTTRRSDEPPAPQRSNHHRIAGYRLDATLAPHGVRNGNAQPQISTAAQLAAVDRALIG